MENLKIPKLYIRLTANLFDGFILLGIFISLSLLAGSSIVDILELKISPVVLIVIIPFIFLYDVLFLYYFGKTPGKYLFSLRVISTKNNALSMRQIIVRFFTSKLPGSLGGADTIRALENKQRKTWHDIWSNTLVIQEKKLTFWQYLLLVITFLLILPALLIFLSLVSIGQMMGGTG